MKLVTAGAFNITFILQPSLSQHRLNHIPCPGNPSKVERRELPDSCQFRVIDRPRAVAMDSPRKSAFTCTRYQTSDKKMTDENRFNGFLYPFHMHTTFSVRHQTFSVRPQTSDKNRSRTDFLRKFAYASSCKATPSIRSHCIFLLQNMLAFGWFPV